MADLGSPVVIVSAFGRGRWLAADLAKEGIRTALFDVTPKLGRWPAEDVEGPFGYFSFDGLNEMQLEQISQDDPLQEIINGLTFWFDHGPLEMRGPITQFKLEKIRQIASEKNHGKLNEFDRLWLEHFSHQWAGTTYVGNGRGASEGAPLSLKNPFYIRKVSEKGLHKAIHYLEKRGVEIHQPQNIVDASFGVGRSFSGLEISGTKQGLFKLEQIVWTLTSEETYFLNERLGRYIFPDGPLEPEWCWVRYRVALQTCLEVEMLPPHLVIINDLYSPWTHENLLIVQKALGSIQYDTWIRIPNVQRFNREYLTMRGDHIKKLLSSKLPLAKPEILSFPQEYYVTHVDLGASRFPVFGELQKKRRGQNLFGNLHLDGPEVWPHYSAEAQFVHQMSIKNKVIAWWKEKLLREQKTKRKDPVS